MSVRQGQTVETILTNRKLAWNQSWDGGPVLAGQAKLLGGGMHITVLSPRRTELDRLAKHWRKQVERSNLPDLPAQLEAEDDAAPAVKSGGVLVLYAARDAKWKEQLERHVRQSESGVAWEFESLEGAKLLESTRQATLKRVVANSGQVLLLISAHALASRAFTQQVLPTLEDASESDSRFATWVLLEPCEWRRLPLAQFQAANDVQRPLSKLSSAELEQTLGTIVQTLESLARRVSRPQVPEEQLGTVLSIEALASADFSEDAGITNAASIAFLAEFNDKALLIGGDARSDVLCESIRSLLSQREQKRLRLDAFVIPHGGSQRNMSRELLELLDCDKYLVSTNGGVFHHPDRETIARIITFGRATPDRTLTLVFNYRSPFTQIWADPELQRQYRYTAIYPQEADAGIKVQI